MARVQRVNRTDLGEPVNKHSWPRRKVSKIDCRKRDVILRITDWTDDIEEPAYDVEVYIHGVYDWNESKVFSTRNGDRTKAEAQALAVAFAIRQIAKFLNTEL